MTTKHGRQCTVRVEPGRSLLGPVWEVEIDPSTRHTAHLPPADVDPEWLARVIADEYDAGVNAAFHRALDRMTTCQLCGRKLIEGMKVVRHEHGMAHADCVRRADWQRGDHDC